MSFDMSPDEKCDPLCLVLWLAEATEHTDNITEFVHVVLAHLWTEVGLPGALPRDGHGFIDLAAVQRVRESLRKWPDIDKLVANTTVSMARFYSFERSVDVRTVEDVALAAGFDTHSFRRDLVVMSPDNQRRSTMPESQRDLLATED